MEIVSFVILHYRDRETTDACVQSILRLEGQERIRIVIVDNDIDQDAALRQELAEAYRSNPRITVLPVHENGGFSYANNQGYRYSRETLGASCIIAANNDVEFIQPDFLERMEKSCREHPCHVLGPDVIRRGNREHQNPVDTRIRTREEAAYTVRMNRLAQNYYPVLYPVLYWKLKREEQVRLRQKKENETFYQNVQENIVPFGACLIFTKAFTEREELAFTPETRFFYEEYILTYRCRKKGYRTIYDPALKVLHESGAETKKTFGSERKRLRFMLERTEQAAKIYLEMLLEDSRCAKKRKK